MGLNYVFHNYVPGGPGFEGNPFWTYNTTQSAQTCSYPSEEPCEAVGGGEPISWETILDWTQTALDIIGFIPGPIGMIADVLNTGISLARGDYAGAALNAIGIIPGLGDAAKAAKMGANALQGAAKLADAAKTAGKLADAGKGAGKSGLGMGRTASNLSEGHHVIDAGRGASRGAEAASTARKADASSRHCKVGDGCFVGDTLVILRPLTRKEQVASQLNAAEQENASEESAELSGSALVGGAAIVGLTGAALALVGDRRRRRGNLSVVDVIFGGQPVEWYCSHRNGYRTDEETWPRDSSESDMEEVYDQLAASSHRDSQHDFTLTEWAEDGASQSFSNAMNRKAPARARAHNAAVLTPGQDAPREPVAAVSQSRKRQHRSSHAPRFPFVRLLGVFLALTGALFCSWFIWDSGPQAQRQRSDGGFVRRS